MERLIAANTVAYGAHDTAPASGTPGLATDGNPALLVPATRWPAYAWNMLSEEIRNTILAAGLTPSKADWSQLAKAVQSQAMNYAADTGTANAMAVTLSPAPASLAALTGVPVRVKKGATANTGAVTVSVNGLGAAAVTWPDGAALTAADLPANAMLELRGTGTAFMLVSATQRPVLPADSVLTAGNPGWVKLPSGLIIQWAQLTVGTSGTTWTFPRSFPTSVFAVLATPNSGGAPSTDDVVWVVGTPSTTQASFDARTTSAVVAYLVAIGY